MAVWLCHESKGGWWRSAGEVEEEEVCISSDSNNILYRNLQYIVGRLEPLDVIYVTLFMLFMQWYGWLYVRCAGYRYISVSVTFNNYKLAAGVPTPIWV